jgi:hypothetical protein
MTSAEQRRYWKDFNAFQQKWEKVFVSKFKKALRIQVEAYAKTANTMEIPSFPIYTVLLELYTTVGPRWARFIREDSIKADDTFARGQMGFNERIVQLIRDYYGVNLLNDAELMTQYSREVIVRVLGQAAETGASFDDIVKELLKHPEFGAMRARRIARTETVTAANGAAMLYANESGNVMQKIWIAVKDSRTRHDHKAVDGTRLDIQTPFDLINQKYGKIQMMQPGARIQPNGLPVPAVEVVNCRCTVAFRAKRGADGRIIRKNLK